MNMIKTKKILFKAISYAILIFAIFIVLVPLAWIISTSMKHNTEIFVNPPYWIPKLPSFNSYVSVLTESSIPRAFLNSLIVSLLTAFMALFFGGSAGYAFARFKFRGNQSLSLFMLLSQMLPLTVLMIPLYYMENNIGLIDTKLGLALADLVVALPFVTWMAKGYFKGVPKEIEEAATIDGCGTLQTFLRIIFPLVRPAIAATGVYAFISSWNSFVLANVLSRTMNSRTVPIALNEFSSFFEVNWGHTMAAATIITVPIIILFMSIQNQFVEGLASGAVKG